MQNRALTLLAALLVSIVLLGLLLWSLMGNVVSNIAYGTDERQRLDVYPAEDCPTEGCTVVLVVHGGGWSAGSKNDVYRSGVGENLQAHHLVVVAVSHRLAPAYKFPAPAEDIAAALAWTKANILQYGGNPARVFLLGHSSGAHLVSLVATNPFYLERYGFAPQKDIAGVISLDTENLDLVRRMRIKGDSDTIRLNAFPVGSEQSASPFWNVTTGRSFPRFLLTAVSNNEETIKQAGAMAAKLSEAGGSSQTAVLSYQGDENSHVTIWNDLAEPDSAITQKVLSFIATP